MAGKARRKPLGTVPELSPEEIAQLAKVTPEDIEIARRKLTPELAQLLNARPMGKRRGHARPVQRPA